MRTTMRKAAWTVSLLGVLGLSGCVVAPIDDGYADYGYTSTTVYTDYGHPPPPRVEYRTVAPSASHIWLGGDWHWGGSRYDWRPGHWVAPGFRAMPPPPPRGHRPIVQPPRPHMMPMPRPDRPVVRPDPRPRPPQIRPSPDRPHPPNAHQGPRPQQQVRPGGGVRPPQMRPDRPGQQQQARPDRPRPEHARPQRNEGAERRPQPQRRDRDDERR